MALNAMLVHLERHGSVWCGNVLVKLNFLSSFQMKTFLVVLTLDWTL